jgi:hypothetical protein
VAAAALELDELGAMTPEALVRINQKSVVMWRLTALLQALRDELKRVRSKRNRA